MKWKRRDHPRLCGEKTLFAHQDAGKRRITPAYAGKRSASCGRVEAVRDHPRLCGEKDVDCKTIAGEAGSPPPMRGKVLGCGIGNGKERITPAYAGKSFLEHL